jgi:hypothetical protein
MPSSKIHFLISVFIAEFIIEEFPPSGRLPVVIIGLGYGEGVVTHFFKGV